VAAVAWSGNLDTFLNETTQKEHSMKKPARAAVLIIVGTALAVAPVAASSTAITGKTVRAGCVPGALRTVPQSVVAAWARNDALAFASVWAPDGDLVVGEGTRLVGQPRSPRICVAAMPVR
jgi:hypothetical protein